jgi:hypothetical protein
MRPSWFRIGHIAVNIGERDFHRLDLQVHAVGRIDWVTRNIEVPRMPSAISAAMPWPFGGARAGGSHGNPAPAVHPVCAVRGEIDALISAPCFSREPLFLRDLAAIKASPRV